MLENFNNYGPYAELVQNGKMIVDVSTINIDNYNNHLKSILNILRDGIETEFVQSTFITVDFGNGNIADLTIIDYFFNLVMWYLMVRTMEPINPQHLFFDEAITKNTIKKYIDNHFIEINRKKFSNIELNQIISDTLETYKYIDDFSMYLCNTINLEDTIELMNKYPEFNDIIHADLSKVPLEDVKNVGMELTYKAVDYIKNSDHCLSNSFRAGEGINIKQYKEFSINIGSKPDGKGGVFPAIINSSFLTGGVNDLLSYFIESSTGRTAQILTKMNVGSSGHFARLLGLNNMDTIIHPDPNYICDTKNFQVVKITNHKMLEMFENRYFRLSPNGVEYIMKPRKFKHLVGETLYFRSPMTCASNSRNQGICYRCYGDLAHTNHDINIGKLSAEILSAILTQILLSAKHLLESLVKKIEWRNQRTFFDIFEIEGNIVKLIEDFNYKGYKLLIDPNNIFLEDEYDDYEYNEYITEFEVESSEGNILKFSTKDSDNIYIGVDLNEIIRKKGEPVDGKISINLIDLKDSAIFLLMIHNNELSRTLDKLKDIIDKNSITKSMNRHQLLQAMLETVIEGNLNVDAVHCEVILSNQIRHIDNVLERAEWQYPDEPCDILTLNQALMNNPSIVITLSYQRLTKTLYNPLTFRKNAPSFMDLFFIEKPSEFLNSTEIVQSKKKIDEEDDVLKPAIIFYPKETTEEELDCDE